MNWGAKIVVVFVLFVSMILTLVYKSSQQKVDLVAPNYYEQELKYQEKIDGINNLNTNNNTLSVMTSNNAVEFIFDTLQGTPEGSILFFKPDNAKADFNTPIKTDDSGRQIILKQDLFNGLYIVKIDWKQNGNHYFKEERIRIN